MPKRPLDMDVLTAARQRISWTFDHFPRVYVSFSAGKDSTVMLHLVADEARARGALALARVAFTEFAHGLRRHIDFEEQLLFPEFEVRCRLDVPDGPTAVMRAEHRAIAAILLVMEKEIDDPAAAIEFSRAALRQIQHDHDLKEEQILYPALDRMLDKAEGDAMVARLQAWARP